MKMPQMDTFRLPVSPSHAATAAGLIVVKTMPGLAPEPKGIITACLVGVYVLAETIYATVKSKKLTLPEEVQKLQARVQELEA